MKPLSHWIPNVPAEELRKHLGTEKEPDFNLPTLVKILLYNIDCFSSQENPQWLAVKSKGTEGLTWFWVRIACRWLAEGWWHKNIVFWYCQQGGTGREGNKRKNRVSWWGRHAPGLLSNMRGWSPSPTVVWEVGISIMNKAFTRSRLFTARRWSLQPNGLCRCLAVDSGLLWPPPLSSFPWLFLGTLGPCGNSQEGSGAHQMFRVLPGAKP